MWIAQRILDRIGVRWKRLVGIKVDLTLFHGHMGHQRIRRVFQSPIAADHHRRHMTEVVNQRAAQRHQHEWNGQPQDQLTADRGAHAGFASSSLYPKPRKLRMMAAVPSLARRRETCTSTAFGVMS